MRDGRHHDRGRCGGTREQVGERDEAVGDLAPGKRRTQVKGVDDIVLLAWAPECVVAVETAGSERMQVREHLERGTLPCICLGGHGRGHRRTRGNRATEGRTVQTRAHDIQRDVRTLESSRVTCSDEGRSRGYLAGAGTYAAIPEEPIDLKPSRVASLADARQTGECGERIAQ